MKDAHKKDVWLDVDMNDKSAAAMEEGVKNSKCVIAIITGPTVEARDREKIKLRRTFAPCLQVTHSHAQNGADAFAIVPCLRPCPCPRHSHLFGAPKADDPDGEKGRKNAYFAREFCIMELRWALKYNVRIQPVVM